MVYSFELSEKKKKNRGEVEFELLIKMKNENQSIDKEGVAGCVQYRKKWSGKWDIV